MTSHFRDRLTDLEPEEEDFLEEHGSEWDQIRVRHDNCPSPALIAAADCGVLPEDVAADVSAHVTVCSFCQVLARQPEHDAAAPVENTVTTSPSARAAWGRRIRLRRSPRRMMSLAAAASLVLVTSWWASRDRSPVSAPRSDVTRSAPESRPGSALVLEKLAAPPPATALVWRGVRPGEQETSAGDLGVGLDAYRDNDFVGAEQRLREAARSHPGTGEVHLYWGISLLFLGRPSEAIEALASARRLTEGSRQQDAAWYLALAYQRSGASDLASAELRALCQGGGVRAARACTGVQQLAESSQRTAPR